MNLPSAGDVFVAFFATGRQADPAEVKSGPRDRIENLEVCRDSRYRAEATLAADEPEPEAEP